MQEFLSRENVARGTLLFVLCTFAGVFLGFVWSGTQDTRQVFREMRVEMLLGACLCMFVDWLFGALRFHIFIRKVKPDIRFRGQPTGQLSDTLCFLSYTLSDRRDWASLYLHADRRAVVRGDNIRHHLFSFHDNHADSLRRWYCLVRSPFFTQRDPLGESI